MNNNIDIFFDDNQSLNPCLIDEEIIKKVIDKDINENKLFNKWYPIIYDCIKNNIYYIIIIFIITIFLSYRFYINNNNETELNELNNKKNLIIETLLKKYENRENIKDILIDQKDIENKQLKILNNLKKLKKKKKQKKIENYNNNYFNY